MEAISNNKRIAKNTIYLYIRMFFVLIVSLYTSRVVLSTLGVVDYGIYNVVSGFVSLFAFLNATLSASVQRFYNYEGTLNGFEGFRSVYIAALIIHIGLSIVIFLLLESFGIWYINNIMVLPPERLFAANVVFQTSVVSLLIVFLQAPYVGAIMAKQCMSFYAVVSIIDTILKLLIVLALPYIPYDKLLIYSFLALTTSLLDLSLYYFYSKSKFKEISFRFVINKPLLVRIIGFTGWNVIGTFAYMLKGQGINMLLNVFFGPVINAARGIAYQVEGAISGFSGNIAIAFRPQIVNNYAQNELDGTRNLIYTESRVCFMLIATLITPVFIDLKYILHLWLGDSIPDLTYSFTLLVLIDALVCSLNTPCTQIVQATGNIRKYQIGSTIVNLLLLPVCWIFLRFGFTPIIVFVLIILFSIANQIVCLLLANKTFPIDLNRYSNDVLVPCLFYLVLLPIFPLLIFYILDTTFLRFLLIGVSTLLAAAPLSYCFALSKSQRVELNTMIISKIKRNA